MGGCPRKRAGNRNGRAGYALPERQDREEAASSDEEDDESEVLDRSSAMKTIVRRSE
jgi:hypothetical protein